MTTATHTPILDVLRRVDANGQHYWSAIDIAALYQIDTDAVYAQVNALRGALDDASHDHIHEVTVTTASGVSAETHTDYRLSTVAMFALIASSPNGMFNANRSHALSYFADLLTIPNVTVPNSPAALFGTSDSHAAPQRATDALVISEYLKEHFGDPVEARRKASQFGKIVKKLYREKHDCEPPAVSVELEDGHVVEVADYRTKDQDLFDTAIKEF